MALTITLQKLPLRIIFPQNNKKNGFFFYHRQNRLHGFKDLFILPLFLSNP